MRTPLWSTFLRSYSAHKRVFFAASLLGVTIRIVGWPINWAALTFSPVSAVAVKSGIGLL